MQLKIHLADVDTKKQHVHNCLKCVDDKATIVLQLVDSYLLEANGDTEEIKLTQQTLMGIQSEIAAFRISLQTVS